ncbi:MCP four helix bundle domain-containing protein [Kordiimonas sp. SCSIO 12603]|uniref:methyl-accepting chemotaxis protein n=1 Tax=Kordiimonas sp. SCSIO 12603 TaxID=2829596 RepID=UPI002105CDF3|nr:methyl-accepting chemotaxis protein [Kordiimonas sp. SCSIO 12603]UTW57432.1 MCP four helix bundle domain-containing protein [Kordiimonas sp. SCSIO 12603]
MNFIKNAKINTRLFWGFGILIVLMVSLTVVGSNDVSRVNNMLTIINDVNSVKQRYAINFRGSVHDRAIALRDVTLLTDLDELDETLNEIEKLTEDYSVSAVAMDKLFRERDDITSDERAILARIKDIEAKTLPIIDSVLKARDAGEIDEATSMVVYEARPAFVTWLKIINEFIDLQEEKNKVVTDQARGVTESFQLQMTLLTLAAVVFGVLVAGWTIVSIRPLKNLTDSILQLSEGNLDVTIPDSKSGDEVGMITGATKVFQENAIAAEELRKQAELQEEQERERERERQEREATAKEERRLTKEREEEEARQQRRSAMLALADSFEGSVMKLVEEVALSAKEMEASANSMTSSVELSTSISSEVLQASNEANNSAQGVASAASELSSSVREIAQQTNQSSSGAGEAVNMTEMAGSDVTNLEQAAQKIGDVIKLINDIAEQTNLLALNATIEAARAGDAGKGFAVVASEVKSLANQTATATQEISTQVSEMQNATGKAVKAIGQIQSKIRGIGDTAISIASAVEEQDASTQEIARNINEVSAVTSNVTEKISEVRMSAEDTGNSAQMVLQAAQSLSVKSEEVRENVQNFLSSIRSE